MQLVTVEINPVVWIMLAAAVLGLLVYFILRMRRGRNKK